MKILHITATHLNMSGGIPVVLKNLVDNQNKINNVEARVISIRATVEKVKSKYFYHYNSIDEIEFAIDEFKPDKVIIHGVYFKEYTKISNILTRKMIDYYIEPHSSFGKNAQKKSKIKKKIANKLIFNKFISNAKGYIFLNSQEKNNSIFRKNTDIIIPNGIITKNINIQKNDENIKMYYIGRFDKIHKGLDILFNALEELDKEKVEFDIDFYGTGTNSEIKYVKKRIAKIRNIRAEYKGAIYGNEKEKILREYNIMILTSRYEGFPITVLEALSYGCPCIVSDGTNVRDIIEDNELGWGCNKDDVSRTIIRAINEYSSKKDLYIKNTAEFVLENYNWSNISLQSINELK